MPSQQLSVVFFVWIAGPASGRNLTPESQNTLVFPTPEAIVDAADGGTRRVVQPTKIHSFVAQDRSRQIAGFLGPTKYRLNVESLALAVLIVCGDAFRRLRLNVIDTKDVRYAIYPRHRSIAGMA